MVDMSAETWLEGYAAGQRWAIRTLRAEHGRAADFLEEKAEQTSGGGDDADATGVVSSLGPSDQPASNNQ